MSVQILIGDALAMLNPKYAAMAKARIERDAPLFTQVAQSTPAPMAAE